MKHYIDVTQEAGRAFFSKGIQGKIAMLNLLKYKEVADYSDHPHLAPTDAISGEQAYKLYMKEANPLIHAAGSKVLFSGKADHFLIGPAEEKWDLMLLVEHQSPEAFLAFAQDEAYLKIVGHRSAALLDSRLLPITI